MKYFRFRKYTEDAFTSYSLMVPPKMTVIYYHDQLAGVDLPEGDLEEFLTFQHPNCDVTLQSFEDVEMELKNSHIYESINDIVKKMIKNKYSIEEEISMLKREKTDPEYVAYEEYVADCLALGRAMKIEKGLKCTAL